MIKPSWIFKNIDDELVKKISSEFDLPKMISQIMSLREITNKKEIDAFFKPNPIQMHDPFLMKDMDVSVDKILLQIQQKERILILGDYDVDGTTGTSLLYLFLNSIGGDVQYYIPNRETEGYGLSEQGINFASAIGATVLITVDCGINAFEKVEYANSKNIDVIITDHHKQGITLPDAYAILNPNQHECNYPFKGLCGAGVAFKLALAVCERGKFEMDHIWQHADLVALGIAADLVPVTDENRVIVNKGIKLIQKGQKPGIRAMTHAAGLQDKEITVGRMVFWIAPKINAAGRLGDGGRAVKLLTTTNPVFAHELAQELERENKKRQNITLNNVDEAIYKVNSQFDPDRDYAIVLSDRKWHAGVIGIVASRIKELYYRPVVVLSIDSNGMAKGSCRSILKFDLYDALTDCKDILEGFGGHPIAAGLTIKEDNIPAFKDRFLEIAKSKIDSSDIVPELKLDGILPIREINGRFINFLKALAPYGPGNMRPKFVSRNVSVIGTPRLIGKDCNTLKFTVKQNHAEFDTIGFGMATHYEKLLANQPIDIAYEVGENEWKGKKTIQLELKDIKLREE